MELLEPMAPAAHRILQIAGDPKSSVSDLVKVIQYDQALTANLLRICNSAGFGLRREIDSVKTVVQEIMRKIKASFGEGLFEDPKKFLAILPPVKKKNCLLMLQELTAHNRDLGEINRKRVEVEAKLKLERDPVVIVTEEVFPGTVISMENRSESSHTSGTSDCR